MYVSLGLRYIKALALILMALLTSLEHTDHFNDLGVLFDEKLTFREHMHQKINKAYLMLGVGLITTKFKYLTRLTLSSFIILYKTMVRSHLDYCS